MRRYIIALLIIISFSSYAQLELQNAFPNLAFEKPVDLQSSKDSTNRLFVVEQRGVIKVFENSPSASVSKVFLDISSKVVSGGELGLLGLAFHPDYKNNGYFYINYTTSPSDIKSRISRFTVSAADPDIADPTSEQILIEQDQPFANHNGGQTTFGSDGFLYLALGDGGSGGDPMNNAQNKSTLLGKILRIDVNTTSAGKNYGIPSDNPYAGNTQGWKEEIYTLGMRNPWRFSFDPVTGWLWCADVGQGDWEEIDILKKGGNYGWKCYEGTHPFATTGCNDVYISPVYEYDHSGSNCSVTGGFVYRGSTVPELYGKYIYSDYCSKRFWSLDYDSISAPVNTSLFTASTGAPVSFGTDDKNELYICTFDGNIYRFKPTTVNINDSKDELGYNLEQNYPNPFNPATVIKFTVPDESSVKIEVLDALGKVVSELHDTSKPAGSFELSWDASGFSSGIYFIRMSAESKGSLKRFTRIIKTAYIK